MLDFPNTPAIGDLFPDPAIPGIPQWRWDGARWASTAAIHAPVWIGPTSPADPRRGNLWFNINASRLMIFIDPEWIEAAATNAGSTEEAEPGQVGELIVRTSASVHVPNNTWVNVVSFTLPAGDWDTNAQVFFSFLTGAISNINVNLGASVLVQDLFDSPIVSGRYVRTGYRPFFVSVPTLVHLSVSWFGTSPDCLVTAYVYSRRAR